jgi:predicted transcriptional regulator
MRALSVRQPFAELILRGIKTVEYRSRPTRKIGERFWLYASKQRSAISGQRSAGIWSRDLSDAGGTPPPRW